MSEAVLDVKKNNLKKPKIKRLELEYKDMNYIIVNLEEKVIDYNGELWEYFDNTKNELIMDMIWKLDEIDEFQFWPDKTKDHAPLSPMWRLAFYDEFDTYYHRSGATHYPDGFMDLVSVLKNLK